MCREFVERAFYYHISVVCAVAIKCFPVHSIRDVIFSIPKDRSTQIFVVFVVFFSLFNVPVFVLLGGPSIPA